MVASDLGSRREFVHQGETGLLYRTGDVNQLAAAIQSFGSRPELAEKMGRAGWEMVRQRHTPEEHYQKLLSLYEGLVAGKAPQNLEVTTGGQSPGRLRRRASDAPNRVRSQRQRTQVASSVHWRAGSDLEIQRN